MKLDKLFLKPNVVELVEKKLEKLMDENPDFVYSSGSGQCHYDSGPNSEEPCDGCIFGQAFQQLGVEKKYLSDDEVRAFLDRTNSPHSQGVPVDYFPKAPDRWKLIQQKQDQGMPWGKLKTILKYL